MKSRKFLLFATLSQTLTLFVLAIIGNQISTQFQIPNYLLVVLAFVGLSITAVFSYLLQAPSSEHRSEDASTVGWSEMWNRLFKTQKLGRREMFGPRLSDKTANRIINCAVWGVTIFGILAAFARLPLLEKGYAWAWIVGLIAIVFCGYLLLLRTDQSVSQPSIQERFSFFLITSLGLTLYLVFGLVIGFVSNYVIFYSR